MPGTALCPLTVGKQSPLGGITAPHFPNLNKKHKGEKIIPPRPHACKDTSGKMHKGTLTHPNTVAHLLVVCWNPLNVSARKSPCQKDISPYCLVLAKTASTLAP
jgi:hypothetical protein